MLYAEIYLRLKIFAHSCCMFISLLYVDIYLSFEIFFVFCVFSSDLQVLTMASSSTTMSSNNVPSSSSNADSTSKHSTSPPPPVPISRLSLLCKRLHYLILCIIYIILVFLIGVLYLVWLLSDFMNLE